MTETMTRAEILAMLEENTHILFTSEILPVVNAAFGVAIEGSNYQANPDDPKGLRLESGEGFAQGISARDLATRLCHALDVDYPSMMGRGFQVRACVASLRKAGKEI